MCSERYALDQPFLFLNTQLPPTRSLFSKQSKGIFLSWKTLQVAIPLDPAVLALDNDLAQCVLLR